MAYTYFIEQIRLGEENFSFLPILWCKYIFGLEVLGYLVWRRAYR